jgi:hypothetical protein
MSTLPLYGDPISKADLNPATDRIPVLDVSQIGDAKHKDIAIQDAVEKVGDTRYRAVGSLVAWSDLTGVPSTFPPSSHGHPWGDLTGVPSSFPPSSHNHSAGEITSGTFGAARFSGTATNGFALIIVGGVPTWQQLQAATRATNLSQVFTMGSDEVLTAVDPGADRLLWWNNATKRFEYLVIGTNLSISGGQLNAAGGTTGSTPGGGDPIQTYRASQLIPATTNGAGVDSLENGWNRDYLTFPLSANRYAELEIGWPTGWIGYQYRVVWRSTGTTGNVLFRSEARCFADSSAETGAAGTAVDVTDSASGTAQQVMVSDWSATVTPGGSIADGAPTQIRIGRIGLSETSPLSQTVWVQMIQLRAVPV